MTTLDAKIAATPSLDAIGALQIVALLHPQGCRTYLLAEPTSKQAMAVDVHLDFIAEVVQRVRSAGWTLPYVIDTHTHADHPSGSAGLAARLSSTRIAHRDAQHAGVSRHPADGDTLHLGDVAITVRHAPGHTPDHIVLSTDAAVFCGDTLLIGGVARTDFLGGDPGQLFDSLHRVFDELPDDTVIYPGHDYAGRHKTTLGEERRNNPWLEIQDRAEFVRLLVANPPPRPANMDDLLRLNREGRAIPKTISGPEAQQLIEAGGATSVIDVRMGVEFDGEHIAGSRSIPLDQLPARADEVRATPAPRLLLCRTDVRAGMAREALERLHVGGLTVITGGLEAYLEAGGVTEKGAGGLSLERQVRIAAGGLVLIGVLLGAFVHGAFLGLAAFCGAGMMFAGLTNWCGMGLLLARAPWNRGSGGAGGPVSACAAAAPASCAAQAPAGDCSAPAPEN